MKPIGLCLVALTAFFLTTLAQGFEDPTLALDANHYHRAIQNRYPQTESSQVLTLGRAARYAAQNLWSEAIAEYEKMIAAGDDSQLLWLRLSEAWQGDERTRDQQRERKRALQAAYTAYQRAQTPATQARALFQLGELYELQDQQQQTLKTWQEALGLAENPTIAKRYQQLAKALAFQVKTVSVDSNSASPTICLRYSAKLLQDPNIHYQDYLSIEPALQGAVTARDDRLCIDGAVHGQSYKVSVRPGVKSAAGAVSENSETFSATVEHRQPTVGFRGSTYVLPKTGSQGLPLTTVNVDKVRLRLLRINDRNLTALVNQNRIHTLLSGYSGDQIAQQSGEEIWQGELDISHEQNQEITSAVPMDQIIADTKPGIYVMAAVDAKQENQRWDDQATQWLLVSDLGLTTLRGDDGLHVFVRSLTTAKPVAGIEIKLFARNNTELGTAVSDDEGYLNFAPGLLRGTGGRQAAALLAYGSDTDFNFLDLTRPSFDLSDRGVTGRKVPGPLDAYLYSERGVYRPGETVELMTLLRDNRAVALKQDLPLTFTLIRPDQVEADRFTLTRSSLGGFHTRIPLADNARTGLWKVHAYADPKADPIGELGFQVEDFVPQRLKLALTTDAESLTPGEIVTVAVEGRFLYGAAAAQLNTKAELTLREDPDPYPDYPGFHFGLVQEHWDSKRFEVDIEPTDQQGKTQVALRLDETPDSSRPLKAILRVSLFEPGGRPVNKVLGLAYRNQAFALGLKPLFKDAVEIKQEAAFQVIALNQNGEPQAQAGLRYDVFREDYDYYWYFQNNRWEYKLILRDSEPASGGTLDLGADGKTISQSDLDWGRYRLEVYDPKSDVASSVRFRVGWFVDPSSGDTPDKLQVTLNKSSYQTGDTAQVYVKAPFAGEVLLTVASHKLWTSRVFNLPADGTTIELPIDPAWSPGAYITATAFRPADAQSKRGPGRAIGLTWLGLDPAPRTLQITLDTPDEVKPRQSIELPVTVTGMTPGQAAYITVAAVDEGILQLTEFDSPKPLDHYLGKRKLGLEILDLYGKLIDAGGRPGKLRSGAGAGNRNLDGSGVRTVKTVALFSGPVELDNDGAARIPLNLPDFNGELRLMAVAWDQEKLGQAEQALLVRDPLVARAYLPRFLAPGDVGSLSLQVQNLSAAMGDYEIRLSTEGAVEIESPGPLTFRVNQPEQALQQAYALRGLYPGVGKIHLEVDGPDGFSLYREWEIGVRPAQTYVNERHASRLTSHASLVLNDAALDQYLPNSIQLRASFSSRPSLNVPALLERLDRYPYGCLEQTTSRALPLLYFDQVSDNWLEPNPTRPGVRDRVQGAIQRVLSMQHYSGGFGLWSPDSRTEAWLSAFALDFLTRAKEQNYLVPQTPYQSGLAWLRESLNATDYAATNLPSRTYALYVLARADQAPLGDLRYLHDNFLKQIPTRLARAQLGAALARYGDLQRAEQAFTTAFKDYQPDSADRQPGDYGSGLRDQAALVALLAESGVLQDRLAEFAEELAQMQQEARYTSTQEDTWLLLAAHTLGTQSGHLNLRLDGQTLPEDADPYYLNPDVDELARGLVLSNKSDTSVWYTVSTSGIPSEPQPPAQEGFVITRQFYTRDGKEVDPNDVLQNDQLLAVITGEALTRKQHQVLIVDLLPAGLEIENARLANNESSVDYKWLPELSATEHVEFRDDRFVAALDLNEQVRNFTVAYLVRAVTPGNYVLPAVFVEDMYKPQYFGRGAMGRLAVK